MLLPQRAAWIESSRSLLIADAHFGKTAHFRKAGIPVPQAMFSKDLDRLSELIVQLKPDEILFLGDFFHDQANNEWNHLIDFRQQFLECRWIVIPGNHDKPMLRHLHSQGWLHNNNQLQRCGMTLSHDELPDAGAGISGHVHPGTVLRGKGRQSLRLPCFVVKRNEWCILPAFGSFTGLDIVETNASTRVFPLTEQEVLSFVN